MAGLALADTVLADSQQPLETIRAVAADFVTARADGRGGEVVVEAGELDPRLRLAHCEEPLEAFLPAGGKVSGRTTVGVRCPQPRKWKIYVPVHVAIYRSVLVTRRSLQRNAVLARDDLTLERRDVTRLARGYLTDPGAATGRRLKRSVPEGKVLSPATLAVPKLVKRGQRVTLVATGGSVEVRMGGVALMDGTAGQRIRVRNLSSNREVEGIVRSAQVVEILLAGS